MSRILSPYFITIELVFILSFFKCDCERIISIFLTIENKKKWGDFHIGIAFYSLPFENIPILNIVCLSFGSGIFIRGTEKISPFQYYGQRKKQVRISLTCLVRYLYFRRTFLHSRFDFPSISFDILSNLLWSYVEEDLLTLLCMLAIPYMVANPNKISIGIIYPHFIIF